MDSLNTLLPSLIIFAPTIGALLLVLIPRDNESALRNTSLAFTVVTFLMTLMLLQGFDFETSEMQFQVNVPWIAGWNINYQLGIDGMTMDTDGHLYAAVRSEQTFGIYIFTQRGQELGYIQTPELPTNCCFGKGKEASTLYVTAGAGFYRIRLSTRGYHPAVAD